MAYNAKLVRKRPFNFIFECVFFVGLAVAGMYGYFYWQVHQGSKAFDAGKYKEAIEAFENARTFAQHDDGLLFRIGVSYVKLGHPDKAITFYEKVLEATPPDLPFQFSAKLPRPDRFSVYDALGYAHSLMDHYDLVIFYCQNMLAIDPTYALAYKVRGITLYKKAAFRNERGGLAYALRDMEKANQLAPDQMTAEDKKFLESLRKKLGVTAAPVAK